MNPKTKNIALAVVVIVIALIVIRYWNSAPDGAKKQPIATVAFSCDRAKGIIATFYEGEKKTALPGEPPKPTGTVELQFSDGQKMTLAQTISADGARYTNPQESFVFWGRGNGAYVLENGEEKNYTGCIVVAPEVPGLNLPLVYSNSLGGFSLRLPQGYTVNEAHRYQLAPGKEIPGVRFTIPSTMASGTNLSADTYLSVEALIVATSTPNNCSAGLFLDRAKPVLVTDGNITYSVATSSDAAAGNRYTEAIFALPGTNPCIALRYYIHSTAFENYPAGTVTRFDDSALLTEFDAIRRMLMIR